MATQPLPMKDWDDFPLRFTTEYLVKDFLAEVEFYQSIMGFNFLSLDEEYAIVLNPDGSTFSFQACSVQQDVSSFKLQWFTQELDEVIEALKERRVAFEIIQHSSIQRFIRFFSPGQVCLEIWSGAED